MPTSWALTGTAAAFKINLPASSSEDLKQVANIMQCFRRKKLAIGDELFLLRAEGMKTWQEQPTTLQEDTKKRRFWVWATIQ